jgi:CheY-like chemotaxis protein
MSSLGLLDATEAATAGIEVSLAKPVKQSALFDSLAGLFAPKESAVPTAGMFRPAAIPDASHTLEGRRLRILVAEDNPINQRVAQLQFEKLGHRADTVGNGAEALEALARIPYDIVFMDCQMPEMDGFEATQELRRREGNKRHTPVIALTANAMEGSRDRCLAAGMDDFIAKPVRPEDLARALHEFAQPTPDQDAAPDLVDMKILAELSSGDANVLREVVRMFIDQTSETLARLGAAISENNTSEIQKIAHSCAGASAVCGIRELSARLRELERIGHDGELSGAPAAFVQVKGEFERVEKFLIQHIANLNDPMEAL